jgi:hypothetical protein
VHQVRILRSILAVFLLLASAAIAAAQPTLTTDKSDYSPGETVVLSGSGFAPGEIVEMIITCSDDLHPPVRITAIANSLGSFSSTDFVVRTTDAGLTLFVTARGLSSDRIAFTQFTDSTALLYAYADPAGTVCLERRSDGRFKVSPGQTIYLQIKGSVDRPFGVKQLTSLAPAETSVQISWRGVDGIRRITFLHVPVTGDSDITRKTALVPWKVGDFTIAGNSTGLPGTTIVSALSSETTFNVVDASHLAASSYCLLGIIYGNIGTGNAVATMTAPSSPTCTACLQVCGNLQDIGALAWNTAKCSQGCPVGLNITASPAPALAGQPVTFTVNAPVGYVPVSVNWTIVDNNNPSATPVRDSSSVGLTLVRTFAGPGTYKVAASVFTSSDSGCVKNIDFIITVGQAVPVNADCIVINAVEGSPIMPIQLVGTGGAGAPYTFSATGLPPGLSVSLLGEISGTPTASGTFNYTATITDKDGATGTLNCSITVGSKPTATCVTIHAMQGVAITPVQMVGTGGAGGPYTFAALGLPAGLTMSSAGVISGTPTVTGTFSYTITVTDANGVSGTVNCSVTVLSTPTGTCVVINAVQGAAITPVQLVGTGGAGGPYTFVASGLPAGLTMSSTGVISGTPTVNGTFNYTTTVTDANGVSGTLNCSVTVLSTPTANCVVINAVQGAAITPVQLIGTGGAGGPYTFVASGLPAGLTMSSTGVISGAPTVTGTFSYAITVTDASGVSGTVNCSVTVLSRPATSCVVINAVQGIAITPAQLIGSGGAGGPYTFAATGLPAGLTISAAGVISGIPTVTGTFGYTVTVTDKSGVSGTINCSSTVTSRPTTSCVVINAIQGVAINPVQMPGAGGAGAPYTFAAAGLPPGVTMSAAGLISGTPAVTGTFNYTVTITDRSGNKGTVNCSLTVAPPPVICVPSTFNFTGSSPLSGTVGNIRTFKSNGVSVNASAFSRTTRGTWSNAYLGAWSQGLGVTDGSESGSNNTHKVDNLGGRINYVLFEFSSPVVINRAFLDAIGADSDASVWIGTKADPFANHLTLSDAVLASLEVDEDNLTTSTATSRWADVNAGSVQGNVVVISALASDDSPEDSFKLSRMETSCPTPAPACAGVIGNFVWKDSNGNGIQDNGEPGLSGVTVQLKHGSTVIATRTTDANGAYQFTGLCAGSYTVVIPTVPTGHVASPSAVGTNRTTDSNGSPAAVTLATNNASIHSIDFGYVPSGGIPVCPPSTFLFNGNSALDGTNGNIRTFTVNGTKINVSAFSRTSGGSWSSAYLGLYSLGLGVTDSSESGYSNTHKVDNVGGRVNYVLFEFSSPVVVNRALLDAIGADSDISVWIGTKTNPFANHLTLSDSLLGSLGAVEENVTSASTSTRWADINSSNRQGNVLVIAALASDTSAEDEFKISKLDVTCK